MADDRSELPPLIQCMLEPAFYPHRTAPRIELLQTHVSHILLTGDLVYKIKKPVDFGFLNFTTLERRQHACIEEVRLNQRGAPGVYLRVDPISQSGKRYLLDDGSNVVDYAVVMKQLPQEGLFSSLLEAGRLSADHVQELAKTLADYHATTPRISRERNLGTPAAIRGAMDDNYSHTAQFVGSLQARDPFEQTKAFTDSQFRTFQNLLESRLDTGFVRECHGDLHLANICLWNDKIILFDCIEFNDVFRCIDVIQDASFVAMDLHASSRRDLATLFINTYIERTGDFEGLQLLPLYLCRQAYVRAKVNSLITESPQITLNAKKKAEEAAKAYYRLAWQYTQPRRGKIILVAGLSGSGKSTVARDLAGQIDAIHIRSDAVRKHLGGIGIDQRGTDDLYAPAMTDRTYAKLLELGALLASQGFTVILDAKYDRCLKRHGVIEKAAALPVDLKILHCTAPPEELRRRLKNRICDISDATVDLLEKQQQEFEDFDRDEARFVRIVDTTQPVGRSIID